LIKDVTDMASTPHDYGARVRGAIVAAAVGDALGWPQETRSSIVGGQKARNIRPEPEFRTWDRNSGTQFARYRETIEAGEYSDDTQLLLAVARSCLAGDHWLDWFTKIELPAWTLYRRGAGRAIIAAGRAWAAGYAPWTDGYQSKNRRGTDQLLTYFNAGANGVAMRIAPHVIVTIEDDPRELLGRVVADGVTTHGHPRALVGAVLHALAMRYALSRQGTLEYGDLLVALMEEYSWQAPDWLDAALPPNWAKLYMATTGRSIEQSWGDVVAETMELLSIAHRSLARAALANDDETLGALGCYDKSRNGAGTVTAVAAAYIAARTAARPMTGLLRAAFLPRADTDTLASMTASLLGAIHGTGWLGLLADRVQDSPYLHGLSMALADMLTRPGVSRPDLLFSDPATFAMHGIRAKELDRFRRRLFDSEQAMPKEFVDHRPVTEWDRFPLVASGTASVARARLRTLDGQLLIVDDLSRAGHVALAPNDRRGLSSAKVDIDTTSDREQRSSGDVEISLQVSNMAKSLHLYRDILHLPVRREQDGSVKVAQGFRLTELREKQSASTDVHWPSNLRIIIKVDDFQGAVQRAHASALIDVVRLDERQGSEQLSIRDPDGYSLVVVPS
jgi:ADP-ribosylglycohydrolase